MEKYNKNRVTDSLNKSRKNVERSQEILEKLATCLTNDMKDGVHGNFSKFKLILNKFFYFRNSIKELKREGCVVLLTILQIFSGELSDLKKFNIKDDQREEFELTQLILDSVRVLSKFLIKLKTTPPKQTTFIECATFLILLSNMCLVDNNKKFEKPVFKMFGLIWNFLKGTNKLTTDLIASKFVFYYVLLHSRLKLVNQELSENLLRDYRICVLTNNEHCQIVLVNLILQKYLEDGMITQAEKFVNKITIPESIDSFQLARFNYYMGRIKIIQLQYREALVNFKQTLRKINQKKAIGFKQIVSKYFILTKLLMGEIPEPSIYHQSNLAESLEPYLRITQAVRTGDTSLFQAFVNKYLREFERDKTYRLILRLNHNVIKTTLRKINQSYSKITIREISRKLNINNLLETEYVLSKAIKDGIIEAFIDHEEQIMITKNYTSDHLLIDPQFQLDKRIKFCLQLHGQCLKSLSCSDAELKQKNYSKKIDEQKSIEELGQNFFF